MKFDPKDNALRAIIEKGEFGMELESLRINADGSLAQTPHPFDGDKNITRDFCENQTEMITDVFDNIGGVLEHLKSLRGRITDTISENGETLWPFSNPPAFSDPDDIPIADFKGSVYRDYLAEKYGKVKMLLSGIHLNFSLPQSSVEALAKSAGQNVRAFKDALYLGLAADLLSYSWLIVFLTAASPVLDESFFRFGGADESLKMKLSSVRCSEAGYWNFFTPVFDYSSLFAYADSIESYVKSGDIISPSELYYPIRVKPRGKYGLDELRSLGINHIELRMLDINPLSPIGVFERDLEFTHLLILYLLFNGSRSLSRAQQLDAVHNMKQAAHLSSDTKLVFGGSEIPVKRAAEAELLKLLDFAGSYFPQYRQAVDYQFEKLGGKCYADVILELFGDDYVNKGLRLAEKYGRSENHVHAFCRKCGSEL